VVAEQLPRGCRLAQPDTAWTRAQRELGLHAATRARRGLDGKPAAECLDPVFEADEARPSAEVGSAAAIVADADPQDGVTIALDDEDLDVDGGGLRVFGRIGERLGDHVVGADLDLLGQSPVNPYVQLDRDGGAAAERLERWAQPASGPRMTDVYIWPIMSNRLRRD